MKAPFLIASLIFLAAGIHTSAQTDENSYYTDDLDVAIKDAEGKQSGSTHVGNRWYNRSTAQSFGFPKLLNQEMSSEIVDGALDATAAGPGESPPARKSPLELSEQDATASEKDNNDMELLTQDKSSVISTSIQPSANIKNLNPPVWEIERIEYKDAAFSGSATSIRSSATTNAYETPVK